MTNELEALATTAPPALHAAVRIVAHSLRAGLEPRMAAEAEERLSLLARAVAGRAEEVDADAPAPAELAHLSELLEELLREITRQWLLQAPAPTAEEMLQLLGGAERVRQRLRAGIGEDAALLLSGARGLELVVELAHDLRSPLTSILFLTEALREGQSGSVTGLQRRQLGIVYSAALRLVSMASDVIELARGSHRLMEPEPVPFAMGEVLEATRDMLRPIAESKGVLLTVLAPAVGRRHGHPVALSRVLLNLMANALTYTEQGEVEVVVREVGGSRVEFRVRDTGPGIPADERDRLFEPLRPRERGRRYGLSGSGLGLAISRRLVAAMGGELGYRTAPGAGTSFCFTLELPRAKGSS